MKYYNLPKNNNIDLTPESFSLLSCLWEENGITQSSLVDKAIVTRLLNMLISKGYVYKEINKDARRNHLVFLTKEGLELKMKFYL